MATHDIFMPALSSTMTEGKIVEWLKEPGDKVGRGESVLVVESDKADMDVEAFQEGYLGAILMPAGSSAPVGETIGLIVENKDEIIEVQQKSSSLSSQESEKPTLTTSKENSPEEIKQQSEPHIKPSIKEKKSIVTETKEPDFINVGRIVASPRAKKLASQLGVDLSVVKGTGPHGRIQADDVQRTKGQPISVPWIAESDAPAHSSISEAQPSATTVREVKATESLAKPKGSRDQELSGNSFGSPGETVPFNTLQQAVNRNMEASLAFPCFRVGYTINTDKLESFYKEVKPDGVTMTALLAKAVGKTLAKHPQVNAATSSGGIAYPSQVNVAVAVAMEEGGLITPVLKNADKTNLFELSRQWSDLVKRSRSKQLQPDEYSTGTFTLSNLGMFGVDRFDAILPPGTGGILAVAASRPNVIAGKDGSIMVKRQMQVNLTADHRVIYGADGASFLKDLALLIEESPESLGA
ncbi:dihydrolipoamide acetyltransferase family protein [Prochlorococcus sp. MIT 1223]|uniref:dihydrolipoamide acetyltransferase family protein n=1 Tax=Prochlorococcus sp. MIT 1223 TaxID=3096217 RepID=UPI002A757F84|nr:dihydrolipoamide acetyltransferase family protein [Prochlorococcus sp. MIT 1223]